MDLHLRSHICSISFIEKHPQLMKRKVFNKLYFDNIVSAFFMYIFTNYIDLNCHYDPSNWSCSEQTANGMPRTSNSLEAYHKNMGVSWFCLVTTLKKVFQSVIKYSNGYGHVKLSTLVRKLIEEEHHADCDRKTMNASPNIKVSLSVHFQLKSVISGKCQEAFKKLI